MKRSWVGGREGNWQGCAGKRVRQREKEAGTGLSAWERERKEFRMEGGGG